MSIAHRIAAGPTPPGAGPELARLALHGPHDPARAEVEAFIRHVYARQYGARVARFTPWLLALRQGGRIEAAVGYRPAGEPLFLEQYLDLPVEQALARHTGFAPPREQIVEVGHLASARPGAGRRLILLLGEHLLAGPHQWVVGTLTGELRRLLLRLGMTPLALGLADPARLGPAAADWGSYYAHHPVVIAGHLPQAMRRAGAGA